MIELRDRLRQAVADVRTPMSPGHRQAAFLAVALAFVIVAYGAPHRIVRAASTGIGATARPAPPRTTPTTVGASAPPAQPVAVTPATPPPLVATPAPAGDSATADATASGSGQARSAATSSSTTSTTSTSTTTSTTTPTCSVANPLGGCVTAAPTR